MTGASGSPTYWYPSPPHEHRHELAIVVGILLGLIATAFLLAIFLRPEVMRAPSVVTFGGLWALFWLLVVFLFVIWILRASIRGLTGSYHGPRRYGRHFGMDPATQIVRERFARGELTRDQFDQMMRDLDGRRY
ncbi:MAG: hypothetical protein ACREDK_06515 [Thermoplasmata archaeon]